MTMKGLQVASQRDQRDYISQEDEAESPTGGSPSRIQDHEGTQNRRQSINDHLIGIYKDYDLYLAAKNGDNDAFSKVLVRVATAEQASIADILRRLSPAGNMFLHIAAKHGNEAIVTYIAAEDSSLVLCKNSNGETALHLAAKGGHDSTVKALVEIQKKQLHVSSLNEADDDNLFRVEDEKGNAALHAALINGRESVAKYLIQEDPEAPYYQNKSGESALYLAAKAGFVECIASIFQHSIDQERIKKQFEEKSPIEAAIMGKNKDVLEAMWTRNPNLFQLRDVKGRIPLHHAASLGYLEVVLYLLKREPLSAAQRDNDGSLPIHIASINGHVNIISILLKGFPDPEEELLNSDGHNILHLAAANGRFNVVRYILNNSDLTNLINMKDKHGNAPLHLAATQWHPRTVSFLTWDKGVDFELVNGKGMTALDAAEHQMGNNREFRQRFIWFALKCAGVPRSLSRETVGEPTSKKSLNKDIYKEKINTLLLVSTLVATVTFAAGFTVPGGYNSSHTDLGIATMLRVKGFHVFIFCDAIAMYSSIVVAAALIWAQSGDHTLVLKVLLFAHSMLWVTLCMMSMAFTAGIFLVVSKLRWLGAAVLFMGITNNMILFVILIPIGTPFTPRDRTLCRICYYLLYGLALITSSS